MSQEYVVLVDSQDQEIGTEEKIRAHQLGLLHRAFSIFIFRQQNGLTELLLQKRHADKYHCGGLWTNSVCSHPRANESLEQATERRLQEELGIRLPLKKIGSFIYRAEFNNGLTEHEFDHVFIGFYDADKAIAMDPHEIEKIEWIALPTLEQDLMKHPNKYTPWLKQALTIAKQGLA